MLPLEKTTWYEIEWDQEVFLIENGVFGSLVVIERYLQERLDDHIYELVLGNLIDEATRRFVFYGMPTHDDVNPKVVS